MPDESIYIFDACALIALIEHEPGYERLNTQNAGLRVCWNTDIALLTRAAEHKARWRRVSLADCFALALAQTLGGILLTSDHHEFDPLVSAGVKSIEFFR